MSPPPRHPIPSLGHVNADACARVYASAYGMAAAQGVEPQLARDLGAEAVEHFVSVICSLRADGAAQ